MLTWRRDGDLHAVFYSTRNSRAIFQTDPSALPPDPAALSWNCICRWHGEIWKMPLKTYNCRINNCDNQRINKKRVQKQRRGKAVLDCGPAVVVHTSRPSV